MINQIRSDPSIQFRDLRPHPRGAPSQTSSMPTQSDAVTLSGARGVAEKPAVQVTHPLASMLEPVSQKDLQRATLHRPPDPGEFLMAGAGTSTLDPHMRKHFPGAGLLASVALAAGMLMMPMAAHAASPTGVTAPRMSISTPISPVMQDQMANTAALAQSMGVSPNVIGAQSAGPLQQISPDILSMYREMPAGNKKFINDKLHGSTGFLFIQVSNKQAFIDGSAAGKDAFDHMKGVLAESVKSGKLDSTTAQQLSGAIEQFRTMTPDQRAALVQVLEADVASLR